MTQVTGSDPASSQESQKDSASRGRSSALVGRLADRYRDAYRVASSLDTAGLIIKLIALVVVLAGVVGLTAAGAKSAFFVATVIPLGCGAFVIYAIGVLVAAQGQILMATLDSAVNSSPLLSEEERAEIMRIELSVL